MSTLISNIEASYVPQAAAPEAVVQEVAPETTPEVAESEEALLAADPADLSKAEKKEQLSLKKKYQLKVNGKEEEFELDLGNDEEVKKHLQMSRASGSKMQEAAELRKAAEQFIDMLKTNPRKVLSDPNIGIDLKTLAQDIINQELENAAKSPEQLEKEKLQAELEDLRAKHKKDEEDRKSSEFARLQAEEAEKIESGIEGALKESDLPKTPYTVRKMAELMMVALQNDIDLSPKDLIPLLQKQMRVDIKDLFSAANDDILEELIGKENISRARKKQVAKAKTAVAQTANSVKATGQTSTKTEAKNEKKMSIREFLKV